MDHSKEDYTIALRHELNPPNTPLGLNAVAIELTRVHRLSVRIGIFAAHNVRRLIRTPIRSAFLFSSSARCVTRYGICDMFAISSRHKLGFAEEIILVRR